MVDLACHVSSFSRASLTRVVHKSRRLITSHWEVRSCRALSCRVVSCPVVSCRVVSCRVASCQVVSPLLVSCLVRLLVSCHACSLSSCVRSCLFAAWSRHVVPWSCHAVSCRDGEYRMCSVMPCRVRVPQLFLCPVWFVLSGHSLCLLKSGRCIVLGCVMLCHV